MSKIEEKTTTDRSIYVLARLPNSTASFRFQLFYFLLLAPTESRGSECKDKETYNRKKKNSKNSVITNKIARPSIASKRQTITLPRRLLFQKVSTNPSLDAVSWQAKR